MKRPLALDLFCCAGGVTVGLERAGFDVVGVDWKPNPHWCGAGEVHEADLSTAEAVEGVIRAFAPDFVTASPPCQRFSTATPTANRADHPDLIGSTREGMLAAGVPGWIENVATDAVPLTGFWVMLCGTHVGLWNLKRHRRFELIGWRVTQPYHDNGLCMYGPDGGRRVAVAVAGHGPPDAAQSARYKRVGRGTRQLVTVAGDGGCSPGFGGDKEKRAEWRRRSLVTVTGNGPTGGEDRERKRRECVGVFGQGLDGPGQYLGQNRPGPECIRWREAMGWLDGPRDRYSLAQAIPPAYAEWLGTRFLETRKSDPVPASPGRDGGEGS